jgi:hypothetical protein
MTAMYPKGSLKEPEWTPMKTGVLPEDGQICHIVFQCDCNYRPSKPMIRRAMFRTRMSSADGTVIYDDRFRVESGGIIIVGDPAYRILAWSPQVGIPFPEGLEVD